MSHSVTGDDIKAENARWTFGKDVALKFDDHVRRSVPFYLEGHELVKNISDWFLSDGSLCYEMGTSTGALISKLAHHHRDKNVKFAGFDREAGMISQARKRCKSMKNVKLVVSDIMDFEFGKSDLIVSYYTMQFVKPKNRQILFNRIYESLNWGGAFLLFEKVRGSDARFQDILTGLYTDFKLTQGYSSQEIVAKSRSLKGILEPFSTAGNLELLQRAGFKDVMTIMKYVCFEGFLAIK